MAFGHSKRSPAVTQQQRRLRCAGLRAGTLGWVGREQRHWARTGGWHWGLAPGAGFVPCHRAGLWQGLPVGSSWAALL